MPHTHTLPSGGPGASGIDFLVSAAERMRSEVGDDWDLVSFAPRSVTPSGPDYAITRDSVRAYLQFALDTYPPDTVGGIGNLTTEQDAAFLFVSIIVQRRLPRLTLHTQIISGSPVGY